MKLANNYDKQVIPSAGWDQDVFLSLGLGYYQIQIIELEFLQRHGKYLDRLKYVFFFT